MLELIAVFIFVTMWVSTLWFYEESLIVLEHKVAQLEQLSHAQLTGKPILLYTSPVATTEEVDDPLPFNVKRWS